MPTVLGEILSPTYFQADFTARRELGSSRDLSTTNELELDIDDYVNFDKILMRWSLRYKVIYGE